MIHSSKKGCICSKTEKEKEERIVWFLLATLTLVNSYSHMGSTKCSIWPVLSTNKLKGQSQSELWCRYDSLPLS